MLVDQLEMTETATVENYKMQTGTEAERLLLSPSGGEKFYQTDGVSGIYTYVNNTWNTVPVSGPRVNITSKANVYYNSRTYIFRITSFNRKSTYAASATSGIVTFDASKGIITYIAPASGSSDTLTVQRGATITSYPITISPATNFPNLVTQWDSGLTSQAITSVMMFNGDYYITGNYNEPVQKWNSSGVLQWSKLIPQIRYARSVTNDGTNIIVAGSGYGRADSGMVVRLDASDGSLLMSLSSSNILSGDYSEHRRFNGVCTEGTDIYACGYFTWDTAVNAFQRRNAIVKYNSAGAVQWRAGYNFGGSSAVITGAVNEFQQIIHLKGFIYAVGDAKAQSTGNSIGLIVKLDLAGNYIWTRGVSIKATNILDIVTDGEFLYCTTQDSAYEASVSKFDTDGNILKTLNVDPIQNAPIDFTGLAYSNGFLYIAGNMEGFADAAGTDQNALILKIKALDFSVEYVKVVDNIYNAYSQVFHDIDVDEFGNVVVGGTSSIGGTTDYFIVTSFDDFITFDGALPGLTDFVVSDGSSLLNFNVHGNGTYNISASTSTADNRYNYTPVNEVLSDQLGSSITSSF